MQSYLRTMATSNGTSPTPMAQWKEIPVELHDMMLCHVCNQQAFEREPSVVLPCAHVMCLVCLRDRLDLTSFRDRVECTMCAAEWKIPFGNALGFQQDGFSRILDNALLGKSLGETRSISKCALHPREDLSMFCKLCYVSLCSMCSEKHHRKHLSLVEPLEYQRERINYELTGLKSNLDRKIDQLEDLIHELKKNAKKMDADIQLICTQTEEDLKRDIMELERRKNKLVKEAENKKQRLNFEREKTKEKFDQALARIEQLKESLKNDGKFIDILNQKGNESDKLARIPGMKNMIASQKQFSGRRLEVETLTWKDVNKTQPPFSVSCIGSKAHQVKITETETSPPGNDVDIESLFPGLQHVGTVPVQCKSACGTTPFTLFNEQHVIHTFDQEDKADKICIHNHTGNVQHIVSIPGMKKCSAPVVMDAAAGEIVVADVLQKWSDNKKRGRSKTHLRGMLHWLTLSKKKAFEITSHDTMELQCVQYGRMSVDPNGNLLVLTHCTTRNHHRELLTIDKNRVYLRRIPVYQFREPTCAISTGEDHYVVVDTLKQKVKAVSPGDFIQWSYAHPAGEKTRSFLQGVQHSQGTLLVSDPVNHRLHLVNPGDGRHAGYLLQDSDIIKFPRTLHLDEQMGLLSVVQGEDEDSLQMLRPEEVELLVCGNPDLNMAELKKVTTYDGYNAQDGIIKYFWEQVLSMSHDLQKRLLLFTTGSDRIPIGGMSEMTFKITKVNNTNMLPMAHTCFNQLVLPAYRSKKTLRQKVLIAIQNAEGFGIE